MEGTAFGPYQLLSLVGRGGMGEVWRAYDSRTDRIVAVKVLPAHLVSDEAFEQRFRREARVAAALNEPHVVPIHRFGEIDGRLYVDMRLIEGRDLHTVIGGNPLEPRRAVLVIEQIAAALNAAHEAGLVHRDVKPSNILIDDFDFAYLIDFGIARAAEDAGLTATGDTIGTLAYMAPERFTTDQIDRRSDIYALACVLHEFLTGRQPYPGNSFEQQIAAHLTAAPPRPSALADVPVAFDDVIAHGMAKNPDERFPTTLELARAARDALTNTPAHSVARATDSPSPEPPVRSRWRRGTAVPTLLAGFALVGGAVVAITHFGSISPAPPTATFTGTFATEYGPQTTFDGTPREGTIASATWVVRSACGPSGCVATAATVNRPDGVLTRTFDYVDGRWLAVTDDAGRNNCNGVDSRRWERVSLEPRPDGTLVGQFSSAFENGCSSTSSVTYTRTGDPEPGVQLTDPATVPARVSSPAEGFRGRYQRRQADTSSGSASQSDWVVTTMCRRSGDRCLSFLGEDAEPSPLTAQLVFADGKWTEESSSVGRCADGNANNREERAQFPLPRPADDPIPALTGRGTDTYTGGCVGTDSYEIQFTRTGD